MKSSMAVSGRSAIKRASAGGSLPRMAEYISAQINIVRKTQKEIAEDIGYDKPNIITMFKQGLTKVPIGKIEPLAKSLGVDPAYMLRIAMSEYMPETLEAIENLMGGLVTANEMEILKVIRETTGNSDPRMASQAERDAIANAARKLTV